MPRILVPNAVSLISLLTVMPSALLAQRGGEAPVAPASAIGPATSAPTFSVLGLASSVEGGSGITQRSEVWMGATQPLGRLGNVRFSAIANGDVRARDAVGASGAAEGMIALRARARFTGAQVWSAVSYGYVNVNGGLPGQTLGLTPAFGTGLDAAARVDTTVSRRVDIGAIQRAEAGVMSRLSGVEFSVGFSVERASRVTTQTLTIDETNTSLPMQMPLSGRLVSTRSTRSLQRRDIATGIASLGFNTGPTTWLVSMTSPVATTISSDALAPKPRVAPTIASIAIVQPVTAWLSVVGAAATNSASVGSTALRDDLGSGRNRKFAPVVALGVRLAGLPWFGRADDTPGGILSFETHTIGSVDSATISMAKADDASNATDRDTLRIVLLIDAPKAESVELMGDATQWMVTQMTRGRDGKWRAALKLAPGVHRITVRADGGKWIAPPNLPIGNDDYGSPVGMIVVKGGR
ncbi:MAG: glycogen-binding domain-containing protein [Gemmatimonadaceae bacterium]|nr:glycogen-binding domain-containing protein [Gemmatimonadaceae bacterium]